ncbi:hypothetical protein EIP91_007772 [Steccherinum ochraceum]|uniref:Uncharacterized protein n=1 Tax=Steccherinum ochraceum TaxID=92696 RepID=A0A4R0RSV4_9APHY|nr:hypothetical protein EIP91_007772 [Steccherinum ochraceum]
MPTQTFPRSRSGLLKAIRRGEQQLLRLKAKYNASSPINALIPPEILAKILLILVQDHIARWLNEEYNSLEHSSEPYTWIGYTHVCRYWRMVSLKGSSLWSFVVQPSSYQLAFSDLWNTVFARSGQHALAVYAKGTSDWASSFVLPNLYRIEELRFVVPHDRDSRLSLPEDLSLETIMQAPVLRRLHIAGLVLQSLQYHRNTAGTLEDAQPPTALSPLETLSIRSSKWEAHGYLPMPTLTHLELDVWSHLPTGRDTPAASLLHALSGMPLLQYLILRWGWHTEESEEDAEQSLVASEEIQLPRLCLLQLICMGSLSVWMTIIPSLVFPAESRVLIDMHAGWAIGDWEFFTSTWLYMQNRLRLRLSMNEPRHLSSIALAPVLDGMRWTQNAYSRSIAITGWDENLVHFSGKISKSPVCQLTVTFPTVQLGSPLLMEDQELYKMVTSEVRVLHQGVPLPSSEEWHTCFRHMVHVHTLCITSSTHALEALSSPPSATPLFPELVTLIVMAEEYTAADNMSFWDLLHQTLSSRLKQGNRVSKLVLAVPPDYPIQSEDLAGDPSTRRETFTKKFEDVVDVILFDDSPRLRDFQLLLREE